LCLVVHASILSFFYVWRVSFVTPCSPFTAYIYERAAAEAAAGTTPAKKRQ